MRNSIVFRGTARLGRFHFLIHAMLLLALALLFTSGNQAFGQGNGKGAVAGAPVTPYVFTGDLSKAPKAELDQHQTPPQGEKNPGGPAGPRKPPGPPDSGVRGPNGFGF